MIGRPAVSKRGVGKISGTPFNLMQSITLLPLRGNYDLKSIL